MPSHNSNAEWPPAITKLLYELRARIPQPTYTEIACLVTKAGYPVTRSAVGGKVRRLLDREKPVEPKEIFWTPERDALLKELWLSDTPMPEIAALIGCSIGGAHGQRARLGLPKRQQTNGRLHFDFTKAAKKKREKTAPQVTDESIWQPLKGRAPVPITELTNSCCHWPLEIKDDHNVPMFCGAVSNGSTYCADHALIAFQVSRARRPERYFIVNSRS